MGRKHGKVMGNGWKIKYKGGFDKEQWDGGVMEVRKEGERKRFK